MSENIHTFEYRKEASYWEDKLQAYLHDPFDKIFMIQGHEGRGQKVLEIFGSTQPNNENWRRSDGISAGFERGQLPSYSSDQDKNGAINYIKHPVLTHPTGNKISLNIDFKDNISSEDIFSELINFLKLSIKDHSDKFKNNPLEYAKARFFYSHLVLRFLLAENNISGLGGFWHRIPADSRFPDHSIWQHNALVSSLYSTSILSNVENGDIKDASLMVFNITPVQAFIAKARKLRDYWTGSVLLSWLSFIGIKWVMENLGPDHLIYPSLVDQPLINEYLRQEWEISFPSSNTQSDNIQSDKSQIASLPNKFLFIIPAKSADEIATGIQNAIKDAWKTLSTETVNMIKSTIGLKNESYIDELFSKQAYNYWDFQWSVSKLVDKNDINEISKLFTKDAYENSEQLINKFNSIIKKNYTGKGLFYGVSHHLVQSTLAAVKTNTKISRDPENGLKCSICGEFEVLHDNKHKDGQSVKYYSENIKNFWGGVIKKWKNGKSHDFNENEHLCSICAIKRIAASVVKNSSNKNLEILKYTFKNDSFPSTTEMALSDFFNREGIPEKEYSKYANELHDKEKSGEENILYGMKLSPRDKYYAILLMDGDEMGKLINGETIASTWDSALHPEIVKRLKSSTFESSYKKLWGDIFSNENLNKRIVTPAIHAAISESLGDFALYGVLPIVTSDEVGGRLIYAGGDDVCAIVPMDTAFYAANTIQKYYKKNFLEIKSGRGKEIINDWSPSKNKLSIGLGKGKRISISAGILICHHKENLSQMISEAHQLLDEAKSKGDRNACAIKLRKRSGGDRYIIRKWDDPVWNDLLSLQHNFTKYDKSGKLSKSLIYNLENHRTAVLAILEKILDKNNDFDNISFEILDKFIKYQVNHSGNIPNAHDLQTNLTREIISVSINKQYLKHAFNTHDNITQRRKYIDLAFNPDAIILTSFLARNIEIELNGGNND